MRDEAEHQGASGPCPNDCKEALNGSLMLGAMARFNLERYENSTGDRDLTTWYPCQVCSESPEILVKRIEDCFGLGNLKHPSLSVMMGI
jgi:hypothetical protein